MKIGIKMDPNQAYAPISLKFSETDLIHPLALILTLSSDINQYASIIQLFWFDSDNSEVKENRDFFISQIFTNLKIASNPHFKHHVDSFLKNKKNKNIIKSVLKENKCTRRIYDYLEEEFKFTVSYDPKIEYKPDSIVKKLKNSKKSTPDYIKDADVTINNIVETVKEEQK